jgi:hypothetical protein
MGSNTINPAPVLNRNSSDDEILGLLTESPRRTRREANNEGRDPRAQDWRTRTGGQVAMDFSDKEAAPETRRGSTTDTVTASATDTEQIEPEHLRAALDANPELRDAWQEARAYRDGVVRGFESDGCPVFLAAAGRPRGIGPRRF